MTKEKYVAFTGEGVYDTTACDIPVYLSALEGQGIISELSGPSGYSGCKLSIKSKSLEGSASFFRHFGNDSHLFSLCANHVEKERAEYIANNGDISLGKDRDDGPSMEDFLSHVVAFRAKVVDEKSANSALEVMRNRFGKLNISTYEADFQDSENYFELKF